MTKEEIEAFWKTKKQLHEEHLRAILSPFESSEVSAQLIVNCLFLLSMDIIFVFHLKFFKVKILSFEFWQEKKVEFGGNLQRSSSLPPFNTRKGFLDMEPAETNLDKPKKNGW